MCADATRLGVLGGTFDPVHLGHLASAREIAEAFALDRVLMVLAARPPHKGPGGAATVADRWRMLGLALEAEPDGLLEASDVEIRRDGPSYTVDTLRELSDANPGTELFLILGIDAYEEVDTWSRPAELLELANLVVTTRPGRDFPAEGPLPPFAARDRARYDPALGGHVHASGHAVRGHRIRGLEVSATDIRRRAREGLPFEHLTGTAVAHFIHEHRLYGAGEQGPDDAGNERIGTPRKP